MTVCSAQVVAVAIGAGWSGGSCRRWRCSDRSAQGAKTRARALKGVVVARALVRTRSTTTVATATGDYEQRRGKCSEAQGGGSWNSNSSGLGRGRETGGWEGEYEMILK